jgi:hypothetical protein
MCKSFIVHKDENTLIVSQHIPEEFTEEAANDSMNLMQSYSLQHDYIKNEGEMMVA